MLRRLFLAFLALMTAVSPAQAISDRYVVIFGTALETRVNVVADTNGTKYCFDSGRPTDFIFWLDADFVSGTSTLDVKVQHSPDGKNWKDIDSFTQVTTADAIHDFHQAINMSVMKCIRAVIDVGAAGSPNYNVLVRAQYRLQ